MAGVWRVDVGDCRELLRAMPERSVHTCVTSPPYFGLRDYGHDGQIGLEPTPDEFVAALVGVFREVRRVLRDDGTVWLNLGDSYSGSPVGSFNGGGFKDKSAQTGGRDLSGHAQGGQANKANLPGVKPKDLIGIPWLVAFALRADGWYLRSEIIWAKPNPMPEAVTDRPTKSHEQVFLLSKQPRYYYDHDAIREDAVGRNAHDLTGPARNGVPGQTDHTGSRAQTRRAHELAAQHGLTEAHFEAIRACGIGDAGKAQVTQAGHGRNPPEVQALADEAKVVLGGYYREFLIPLGGRNKRDVWTVPTMPYADAHFATYPPKLIEPCILAGCPQGGTVLDPFAGAGTTGMVALRHGRSFVGCELNPEYAQLARCRIATDQRLGYRPPQRQPAPSVDQHNLF